MKSDKVDLGAPEDFSLVLEGPLYRLYQRTRLVRPPLELLRRRIVVIALIAWLPLLLLTALAGQVVTGVQVPFLFDVDVHLKLLVSLPLFLAGEVVVHQRLRTSVLQFLEGDLIAPEDVPRFKEIIAATMRLRSSVWAEAALLVLATVGTHQLWEQRLALSVATWYADVHDGQPQFTTAGYWYAVFSMPIYRFLMYRWYYRLSLWYRFLWQVSRLPLRLNALHPDQAAGLGFLGGSVFAYAPFLLAHTVLAAGLIAGRIWHQGRSLPDFKVDIAIVIGYLTVLVLAPLTFFAVQLSRARRKDAREYGTAASRYVNEFRRKWLAGEAPAGESFLGSGDIQSLADLGNSYNTAHHTRLVPISKETIARLVSLLLLPILPLVLTVLPLSEIVDQVAKLIL
jgi:hypothetical protein